MGKIIVIDGLDGSGKGTQVDLLYSKLKEQGYNVYKMDFPDYNCMSAGAIKMYLNRDLGDNPMELNPYMCSNFYSVNRAVYYHTKLKRILEQDDSIVLADRYISANIIHQGAKILDKDRQKEFFEWTYDNEVDKMGLPLEDMTIILRVPVWKSQELMSARYNNDESKKDLHEVNIDYLEKCYTTVSYAVEHLNRIGYNWKVIDCLNDSNEMKTREEITAEILENINDLL